MAKKSQSKGKARDGASRSGKRRSARRSLVLERRNYILILAGVVLVMFGFVIMRLDNQVESFVSLYLAPLIILAGYAEIAYAIMWKPKASVDEAAPVTKKKSRKSVKA